jgi:hypothetical protein
LTALTVTVCACCAAQDPSQAAASSSTDQPVIKEFDQRVHQYLDTRKKADSDSPPQTADPARLTQYRDKLRSSVIAARSDAKQGDIFTPEVAAYFKRQIATTLRGPHGSRIRSSLKRAEPVHGVPLKINGAYPAKIPLQSTPASLLINLPPLPKELEYRIADRALVLRDKDANLIVDYIPDAIASSLLPSKP